MKPLSKKFSAFLRSYYKGPDHPMKARIWRWFRRMSAYPRMTISYGAGGWITLDERCLVQREIFDRGVYEPEVWQALRDRKSTRLNSSHSDRSRMPSSA